jgi:hypothetical protein
MTKGHYREQVRRDCVLRRRICLIEIPVGFMALPLPDRLRDEGAQANNLGIYLSHKNHL